MARRPVRRRRITQKSGPTLHRLSANERERLEGLMTRNNDGALTGRERQSLQLLVRKVEKMTLDNARVLVERRQQPNQK